MKAEVVSPVIEPDVVLTMTQSEATVLRELMGGSCVTNWEAYLEGCLTVDLDATECASIAGKVYLALYGKV